MAITSLSVSVATPSVLAKQAAAWSGSLFCVVQTNSATCYTSPDGVTWTPRTMPISRNWRGIVWNGSLFIAVSNITNNSINYATSPNGITWTQRSLPKLGCTGITVSKGKALAYRRGLSPWCLVSDDGLTWTEVALPSALVDDCFGSELGFVFVTTTILYSSVDGTSWTETAAPAAFIHAVVRGGGRYCASTTGKIGNEETPGPSLMTSTGLTDWLDGPLDHAIDALAWSGTAFVGFDGTTGTVWGSTDGAVWDSAPALFNRGTGINKAASNNAGRIVYTSDGSIYTFDIAVSREGTLPEGPGGPGNPTPEEGSIWGFGAYEKGTSGSPGTVIFEVPTKLTALGTGWKKAYIPTRAGVLLHSDGTLKVCGHRARLLTASGVPPEQRDFAEYTTIMTSVDDVWTVGTDNDVGRLIVRIGTQYRYLGEGNYNLDPANGTGGTSIAPFPIPSLNGLDIVQITGGYDILYAVTATGEVYAATENAYGYTTGMSRDDWYALGYDDGQFHRIMAGTNWAPTSVGLDGYSIGFMGVNSAGQLLVADSNTPQQGPGYFTGYPTNTGIAPVYVGPPWPTLPTVKRAMPVIAESNGYYAYISDSGQLHTQFLGEGINLRDSRTDWIGSPILPNYNGDLIAVRGAAGNFVAYTLNDNFFPSAQELTAVAVFPLPSIRHGHANMYYSDTVYYSLTMVEGAAGPPPVFWRTFRNAYEVP